MIALDLLARGAMQSGEVPDSERRRAKNHGCLNREPVKTIEWYRFPGDAVSAIFEVLPAATATPRRKGCLR